MVFRAHYDGRVLIPDEPVELPKDKSLHVQVLDEKAPEGDKPSDDDRPLMKLVRLAEQFPDYPDWPADGAAQLDHYLYGTPKHES